MDPDTLTFLEYGTYFVVSLAVTIWVGRTLFRSGRPFLVEAFHGSDAMADSVNNLLIIGFYLVNVGFMLLFLSSKEHPRTGIEVVEHLDPPVLVRFLERASQQVRRRRGGGARGHAFHQPRRPERPAYVGPGVPAARPAAPRLSQLRACADASPSFRAGRRS